MGTVEGKITSEILGSRARPISCIGDRESCSYLYEASWLPWDTGRVPGDTRQLYLRPPPGAHEGGRCKEASSLGRVHHLELPLDLLPGLDACGLPAALRSLSLVWSESAPGYRISSSTFGQLKALAFHGSHHPGYWLDLGFSRATVPGLQLLRTDLEPRGRVLERVATFDRLRCLEVHSLGKQDLFAHVPPTLEVLSVTAADLRSPMEGIRECKGLRALRLNGVCAEFDVRWLTTLPALRDVSFNACIRLRNVEALLELPQVREVSLLDCGRMSVEMLKRFVARRFDSLWIDAHAWSGTTAPAPDVLASRMRALEGKAARSGVRKKAAGRQEPRRKKATRRGRGD